MKIKKNLSISPTAEAILGTSTKQGAYLSAVLIQRAQRLRAANVELRRRPELAPQISQIIERTPIWPTFAVPEQVADLAELAGANAHTVETIANDYAIAAALHTIAVEFWTEGA